MTVLGIAGGQTARALFLATAVLTLPACGPVDEPPAAASERPQTPGSRSRVTAGRSRTSPLRPSEAPG